MPTAARRAGTAISSHDRQQQQQLVAAQGHSERQQQQSAPTGGEQLQHQRPAARGYLLASSFFSAMRQIALRRPAASSYQTRDEEKEKHEEGEGEDAIQDELEAPIIIVTLLIFSPLASFIVNPTVTSSTCAPQEAQRS